MAEAAERGWISTGSAEDYYEDTIVAAIEFNDLFLLETDSSLPEVSDAEINDYLSHPDVDYSNASFLEEAPELINTQYWVVSIKNGSEAFANIKKSGYPDLERNDF